jgi:ATP-dependent RNA helicase RhlE
MSDFKSFDLLPSIKVAIAKKGYKTPTPIQAKAIPHLLKGKDLLGIAQTGTGKTAAFSLPILTLLKNHKVKVRPARVRCLILTPTRELASQIEQNIKGYAEGLKINSTVVFGGVGHRPQIQAMSKGVDILVATPGRLLDLMNEGHVIYEQLEIFVLDEADRMLDMGFFRDVKKIIAKLPSIKQTLLFSATMPQDISSLANSLLKNPEKVEVTPQATTVEKIDQTINMVDRANKGKLLNALLVQPAFKSVLVFSRTKHGANKIVRILERVSIVSAAIHGNKSQGARERALSDFKSGKIKVLVATDIAARGIDIPKVSHVINYDLPEQPESYVHRIGRTARAGRDGIAISFCDQTEVKYLRGIEKFINYKVPVDKTHPFHGVAVTVLQKPEAKKQTKRSPRSRKKTGQGRRRPVK